MEQPPDPPRYIGQDIDGDPPIVADTDSRRTVHADQPDPFRDFFDWLDDTLGSESYGAPRVFDLFTLLAITLAFALMFAFLRVIEPALGTSMAHVALAIGFFSTLTAIAQLALWEGKKPRIASVVAGPPIWLLISFGFLATNPRALVNPANWFGLLCSSLLGLPAGYLGGAVVAGVFLLADMFRNRFMKNPADNNHHEDVDWDDLESVEDDETQAGD